MSTDTTVTCEEFLIPSADPGISLFVRNKRPQGMTSFNPGKILLYVHGATYPAETSFDLPLNGFSWMDYIARHGHDVYLMDVRGYGASTRPPEMDVPADVHPPIVRTETAVQDVGSVVDFILARRGVANLNLMGWSWGTSIMGCYTTRNNAKVNRLVLYAPLWLRSTPTLLQTDGRPDGKPDGKPDLKPMGAYRTVSTAAAKRRWFTGVAEDQQATLIPPGWFEAWLSATFATDPLGAKQVPPVLRVPNGVLQDNQEYWMAGKPYYDPADIRVPTFLVHAEWDADTPSYMLSGYFAKLTHAPYKRCVEIGEGTHSILMEKNRMQLFQAVQQFLDERIEPDQ